MSATAILSFILMIGACFVPCYATDHAFHAGPYSRLNNNFYQPGDLNITVFSTSESKTPLPLDIYTPRQHGIYPVVVFLHGFTGCRRHYETILYHLASHGFIVIAPQMYRAECYGCAPSPAVESLKGLLLLRWIRSRINGFISVTADTDHIGVAGHSRGGQIAFRIAVAAGDTIGAVAGIDPVDGLAAFGQTRVTTRLWRLDTPAYIMGTGLGSVLPDNATFPLPCAPANLGHEEFYAKCAGSAWYAVALDHGHGDMLDEEDFVDGVCPGGSDRAAMRSFTAGTLAAFFSGILQDNADSLLLFTGPDSAPVNCRMEFR